MNILPVEQYPETHLIHDLMKSSGPTVRLSVSCKGLAIVGEDGKSKQQKIELD